jgi:hypothetical protein
VSRVLNEERLARDLDAALATGDNVQLAKVVRRALAPTYLRGVFHFGAVAGLAASGSVILAGIWLGRRTQQPG